MFLEFLIFSARKTDDEPFQKDLQGFIPLEEIPNQLGITQEELDSILQTSFILTRTLNGTTFVHRSIVSLLVNIKTNRSTWDK